MNQGLIVYLRLGLESVRVRVWREGNENVSCAEKMKSLRKEIKETGGITLSTSLYTPSTLLQWFPSNVIECISIEDWDL